MQTRTWSHPEGPEHLVIQEQNRGRWRCQDVVDGPGGATSTPTIPDGERPATVLPASRVDDGAQSPPPACDPHLTHGSGVDGSQPDMDGRDPEPTGPESADYDRDPGPSPPHLCQPDLPPVLDSNFNASPRRQRCRTTKADPVLDTARAPEPWGGWGRRGSDVGVVVVLMAVAASVMSTSLCSPWIVSLLLHWLAAIGRLMMQAVAVLVSTAVVLLALQAHFPSDRVQRWVAGVLQLELRDTGSLPGPKTSPAADDLPCQKDTRPAPDPDPAPDRDPAPDPAPDHDPALDPTLDPGPDPTTTQRDATGHTHTQHCLPCVTEKQTQQFPPCVTEKQTQQFPPCVTEKQTQQFLPCVTAEKQTKPRACTSNAQTGLTNGKAADVEGRDHVVHNVSGKISKGKCYRKVMKNMYRKFLLIRRKFRNEMCVLSGTDRAASTVLSRVQLSLPVLEREKQRLLAELEAIHTQHAEERRRNSDLLARLARLNHHFLKGGAPQGSGVAPRVQPQDHAHFSSGGLTHHPNQTLHPHHPHHYHQHQHQHQYQHQQAPCSRVCGVAVPSLPEELRADSEHIAPLPRPTALSH